LSHSKSEIKTAVRMISITMIYLESLRRRKEKFILNEKYNMQKIQIKPLSVNDAWKGRRFKTDEYKVYEQVLMYKLPAIEVPEGKLRIDYEF
jgi:hypothetical protein